ncbi:MAG: PD40 domain-containing protein, partial [Chloroflexi bacterium]|nr:PD40 domain-containing protein [Chloroflexota bacterium]
MIGGTFYRWALDEEGHPRYAFDGVILDIEAGTRYTLTLPAEMTFLGLDWSPKGGVLVAALTAETGTYLWLFAPDGTAIRSLVEIPNPEQEILTAANPAWSPDGEKIVFELRH